MTEECITLKWGTLKGWHIAEGNSGAMDLLTRYHQLGVCMSAMCQKDSEEQKKIICELVSLPGMKVYLDWDDKFVTQAEGIAYIMNYGAAQ